MNGIKYQLDRFIEKHGESGKKEINTICKAHTITMDLDVDQKVNYNGCKVSSDGELVIIFAEGYLGTNVDDTIAEEKFAPALNDAPTASLASPMSFHARRSINIEYNPHIELIQKRLDDLLQFNVQLEPCFEEVFAKMKAAKSPEPRWEVQFGFFMKEYFEGFVYKLETLKFGEDEMLREGFTEAVEKRAVAFRVVDASNMKKAYNECVLEDGILYLQVRLPVFNTSIPSHLLTCCQTVPEYFGANVGDCAVDVLDVL